VLKDEEELRELVERVEAMTEFGPVAVLPEDAIAETVDRGDGQLREITGVADFASGGSQTVAHLEGGLLRESAEHQLPGLRLLRQQQIQRTKHDAVGLAGTGAGDHEERPVEMTDDGLLGVVERRIVLHDGGRDAHKRPAFRKLNVSWADTIR